MRWVGLLTGWQARSQRLWQLLTAPAQAVTRSGLASQPVLELFSVPRRRDGAGNQAHVVAAVYCLADRRLQRTLRRPQAL